VGDKMNQGEIKFTYSAVLNKGEKKIIRVRFERGQAAELNYAEGIIPDCKIEKQQGFSAQEVEQMESYLEAEKENIIQEAKKLNNILHWF
jgi:hypothetical protein